MGEKYYTQHPAGSGGVGRMELGRKDPSSLVDPIQPPEITRLTQKSGRPDFCVICVNLPNP
jgi:hypothetical protein